MATYRRRLTVDHTRVGDVDLTDFPVLVTLGAEELKAVAAGGHMAAEGAEGLCFTLPDGTTRLAHEVSSCDPDTGELTAWVRLPVLSCTQDTDFLMLYGDLDAPTASNSAWDGDYQLVMHRREVESSSRAAVPGPDGALTNAITVEAWGHCEAYRPEAMQALVSAWEPLASFDTFSAFDAGTTDGLDTSGFYGAVFDGRYVYFCPIRSHKSDRLSVHGNVLRYDTQKDFHDPASYEGFDAGNIDGLRTVCYYGATFDGRYVIFTPRDTGTGYHSHVLRYDTHGGFKESASWSAYNAGLEHSHQSAGFDGRYIYFCPGYTLKPGDSLDGSYIGKLLRLDTRGDFDDDASWEGYDAANTDGLDTGGFDGGYFVGVYVYYVPYQRQVEPGDGKSMYHANYLRYDTRLPFGDPGSWEAHDASGADGLVSVGYNAGAYDGRFFYAAPDFDPDSDKMHGRILRYDTIGERGTFTLKYCDYGHNGGLCAAVPGPSFVVNTASGALSIAAHRALLPGWHHLCGVFTGRSIKLYVDGALVVERSGSGALQACDVPVAIGHIGGGGARFGGDIHEVRISSTVRDRDWILTEYRNLADPRGFVRCGPEEETGH